MTEINDPIKAYADAVKAAKLAAGEAVHAAETEEEIGAALDIMMACVKIEKTIILPTRIRQITKGRS